MHMDKNKTEISKQNKQTRQLRENVQMLYRKSVSQYSSGNPGGRNIFGFPPIRPHLLANWSISESLIPRRSICRSIHSLLSLKQQQRSLK